MTSLPRALWAVVVNRPTDGQRHDRRATWETHRPYWLRTPIVTRTSEQGPS